ncbi:unnamed protein product [Ostreobium quekettii]|uniref:NAD(P)-binding domain-containing protein n=1 Tax=Ostreobium quekettii TaxID=121088 RepID=A0A8S1J107_9CHLO|nr:unnamed protein product [Ostreobium quekettii]
MHRRPGVDLHRPNRPARGPAPPSARKGSKGGESGRKKKQEPPEDAKQLGLDELVDPYKLGRRSRQAFDDVWQQFVRVAQPTRSFSSDDDPSLLAGTSMDLGAPLAAITTVLVVGATGRVGKIILRKLLLRGYDVRALVRGGDGTASEMPPAVGVVEGDVCDYGKCLEAVQGVDKIIYAAGARSFITADIRRVESEGVATLCRAFLDCRWKKAKERGAYGRSSKRQVANFKFSDTCNAWQVELVGNPKDRSQIAKGMKLSEFDGARQWRWRSDTATLQQTDEGNLLFEGQVGTVGGVAEVGAPVNVADSALDNCEALVLRVKGDGNPYSMIISAGA